MTDTTRSQLQASAKRELRIALSRPMPIQQEEEQALRRLIAIAQSDTGQSSRCANFLLAWWNATSCGGFDLTDLWSVDRAIAQDMITVTGLIARLHNYPDAYGLRDEFEQLVRDWRPQLFKDDGEDR